VPTSTRRCLAMLVATMMWLPLAHAVELTSLYTVEVPLKEGEANARSNAFKSALTAVLVRVTESTSEAVSEEMAIMFPNPGQFVMQFETVQAGTLTVTMDGDAIERVLRQYGKTVWGTERPLTVVWLAVDWGRGDREIVGAEDPDRRPGMAGDVDRNKVLRDSIQKVARTRGIPIVFPLLDTEDLQKISFSDVWGGFDNQLLQASVRYGATSILIGRIRPGTTSLQSHQWAWHLDDQQMSWRGEATDAINLMADSLAVRDGVAGNLRAESIRLTISGINSVNAYGQVQFYLEQLRSIDQLKIKTVAADRIIYEVDLRGDVDRLQRALLSSGIFIQVESIVPLDTSPFGSDRNPFGRGLRSRDAARSLEFFYRPDTSN